MNPVEERELIAELHFHADQAASGPANARLANVRERIRTRRRRRVGAAVAFTAACVAVVALAPSLTGLRQAEPSPASSGHPSGPLVFTPDVDGDTLIGSRVGAAGQTSVTFTVTPSDANLSVSGFCRLTAKAPTSPSLSVDVTINGKPAMGSSCGPGSSAGGVSATRSDVPAANRTGWEELGVRAGQPATVRVFVHGDPATLRAATPGLRVGGGVYELTGPRVVSRGIVIKELSDVGGHRYRLAGYRTAAVTATRTSLSILVPAQRYPAVFVAGSQGDLPGASQIRIDDGLESANDAGIIGGATLPDARAHTLEIRLTGHITGRTSGSMVVGYYVRVS